VDIFALAAVAVIAAILSLTIKRYSPEVSVAVSLGGSILIMVVVFSTLSPFLSEIDRLYRGTGMNGEYGKILLKCLGICLISQIASDTCRDANETALASKIEIAGRASVLIAALPMFSQLINIAIKLIGS